MFGPQVLSPVMVLSKDKSAVRHDGAGTGVRHRPASVAAQRGEQPTPLGAGERTVPGTVVGLPNPLEHRHMARELARELRNCQVCKVQGT